MIGLLSYFVADGDWRTTTTPEAGVDVGGDACVSGSAAHPFYTRLHQILDEHDVDRFVEGLCQRFYADQGRPGRPPGRSFRLLLIGYFEGLDAEPAIASRASDSFALRESLGVELPEAPPAHSTIHAVPGSKRAPTEDTWAHARVEPRREAGCAAQ